MNEILIFAGTFEGRKLCEYLSDNAISASVCVATGYGKDILPNMKVYHKRLNENEMVDFIKLNQFGLIIDATHPYAIEVTKNIKNASERTNTNYIRLLRDETQYHDLINVSDTVSAVEFLKNTVGNILVTTGSKELSMFCEIPNFEKRVFARVLPSLEVLEHCNEIGIKGKNLICMQGPFSHSMNVAMLKQFDCKYLVTKNTGSVGGLDEKISAALETDTKVVMIDRPTKEDGYSFSEVIKMCQSYDGNIQNNSKMCEIDSKITDENYQTNSKTNESDFETNEINFEMDQKKHPTVLSDFEISNMIQNSFIETNNVCYNKKEFFPLFIQSKNKAVLVVGGGEIATRRILTLLKFNFDITVVAPIATDEIKSLSKDKKIVYLKRKFKNEDLDHNYIVISATNDRTLNHYVGQVSKKLRILVNIADKKEECDFYFPAIITNDDVVIGVTSEGESHKLVKEISNKIRVVLDREN